jgi:uncharacterized membrane protein YhaH (DUF805 family)
MTNLILATSQQDGSHAFGYVVIIILMAAYFFPTIVAGLRRHHNEGAIFVLNLLLGWTFVGWVASLVWGCTAVNRTNNK